MKIADLFVALGVKGAEKASKDVGAVGKAMKGTRDMSLEAKAALVGAFYAAQRMFAKSGQEGVRLNTFSNLMDTTIDTLQRYQYAARQVGATNEDVASSFSSIQKSMTDVALGRGKPAGLDRIAKATGIQRDDILKFQKNPELIFPFLQEYARKQQNKALRNEDLKSFVGSDAMVSAIVQNAFRPEVFARAPVYSDSQVQSNAKNAVAWSNLENKIEMSFGRFNAQYGGEIVQGFDKIIDALIELATTVMKVAKDAKAFDMIRDGVKLLSETVKNISWFVKEMNAAAKGTGDFKGLKPMFDALKEFLIWASENAKRISDPFLELSAVYASGGFDEIKNRAPVINAPDKVNFKTNADGAIQDLLGIMLNALKTKYMGPTSSASGAPNNVTVNNTMNFSHPGVDPQRTSSDVARQVRAAVRTSPALSGGN